MTSSIADGEIDGDVFLWSHMEKLSNNRPMVNVPSVARA